MKKLITPLLLILFSLPSYASDLPPCPNDQTQTYDNCFSVITLTGGFVTLNDCFCYTFKNFVETY